MYLSCNTWWGDCNDMTRLLLQVTAWHQFFPSRWKHSNTTRCLVRCQRQKWHEFAASYTSNRWEVPQTLIWSHVSFYPTPLNFSFSAYRLFRENCFSSAAKCSYMFTSQCHLIFNRMHTHSVYLFYLWINETNE